LIQVANLYSGGPTMNSRSAVFVSILAVAGCAGGSTMRVNQGEETTATPVALTPEPDTAADSLVQAAPTSSAPELPTDTASTQQGYAPYGTSQGGNSAKQISASPEIRRIGQWTHTGVREARRLVIRDANTWAEFWSELGVGERPAVDFSQNLVIAVASGQRPSGGHEIAISRVTQSNGELTVEVVEATPGPNCMSTSALTQPVDVIVLTGLSVKNWSFVEQKQVRGCQP
jgi:hypothetical protein